MRLHRFSLLFAAALALPLAAHAADDKLSYSYVDAALFPNAEIDADDVDIDGDGLQVRGSLPVYQNFFAFAELQDLDLDEDVDLTRIVIGAGGHWPINNTVDVIARLGIVQYELDAGPFDDDDTGLLLGGTIRAFVAPRVELEGGIEYVQAEVGGVDSDAYLIGEGRYHFTPNLSAGAILTVGGDVSVFGITGRYSF